MSMSSRHLSFIALFLMCFAVGARAAKQELPEVTEDGLYRKHDAKLAIVYVRPGADLAPYQRVWILEPHVAFKKNWEREQRMSSAQPNRLTSKDIENIKLRLAEEFGTVLREELEKAGYALADAADDDVLLIRPAIINLDVNAPDTLSAGRSRTYTESAGEMTLYVELYDSVTSELLAKALDPRADTAYQGFYTWSNSVTNKAAADRIIKGWAQILINALNAAKQPGGAGAGDAE
jgi:hypothetical protein